MIDFCRRIHQSSNVTDNQTISPSLQPQNAQTHINEQQRLDTDLHNLWHGAVANITLSNISSNSLLHFVNPFPSLLPTHLSIFRQFLPLLGHQRRCWWRCGPFCCWIYWLCDSTVSSLFVFCGGQLFL